MNRKSIYQNKWGNSRDKGFCIYPITMGEKDICIYVAYWVLLYIKYKQMYIMYIYMLCVT